MTLMLHGNISGISVTRLIPKPRPSKKPLNEKRNVNDRLTLMGLIKMLKINLPRRALMPLVLSLLAIACSNQSTLSGVNSQPVKQASYPQLPQNARQEPIPQFCSPTCTANLTNVREN